MAKLVTDDDIYGYLDIEDADEDDPNGNVLKLRDFAEEVLERETNRVYGPGEVITREYYDGPGGYRIFTRRPIASLQAIDFRYLPETLQESYFSLDITQYITFTVGKRRIQSHIYEFPRGTDNVLISYTSSDDMPQTAKMGVMDVVAACYRRFGSEDARSEQKGSFQHSMIRAMNESIMWSKAIELLNIPSIG